VSFFLAFGDELTKLAKMSTLKKVILGGGAVAAGGVAAKKALEDSDEEWLEKRMKGKKTDPRAKWLYSKLKGTAWAPSKAAVKKYRASQAPAAKAKRAAAVKSHKKWTKTTSKLNPFSEKKS
jgi:hypothetical protein